MTSFIFSWVGVMLAVVLIGSAVMITYISQNAAEEAVSLSLGKELRKFRDSITANRDATDVQLDDSIGMENCRIVVLDENGAYVRGIYDAQMQAAVDEKVDTSVRVREVRVGSTRYYVLDRSLHVRALKTGAGDRTTDAGSGKRYDGHCYIRAITAVDSVITQYHELQVRYYLLAVAIGIVFVLLIIWVYRKVMRPLNEIVDKAERISESHTYSERMTQDGYFYETEVFAKAYNRLLDHTEKLVEQQEKFNSDVSHELRTPVSLILSECELVQDVYCDQLSQETAASIAVIKGQCYRMKDMITELLYLSKLDQESGLSRAERVDVVDILEPIYEDTEYLLQSSRVLEKDFHSVSIDVDLPLIVIAIRNLVSNAIKYSSENDVIRLSDSYDDENVYISISDSGIGIDAEQQDKVFDYYYQVSGERNADGFGLGLTLALRIVKMHGGTIDVSSELHEGSTFTVTLPKAKEIQ